MKILFIHHKLNASFIKNDLKILQKHYDVEDFYYTPKRTLQLFKKIKTCDLVYVWFISYPAYLVSLINKLYRKKIILVAGGYGVQSNVLKKHKIFRLMVKSAIKNATEILAVSKFTKKEVSKINPCVHCNVVYNGIDTELFKDYKLRDNKKPVALTVGNIFSMDRYYLKGIDKFINLARKNPQGVFYVIGMCDKVARKIQNVPSNCYFFSPVSQESLPFFYSITDTYYQLSRYESFCLTLLEARACGCNTVTSAESTAMDEIQGMFVEELSLENREKNLIKILNNYKEWY